MNNQFDYIRWNKDRDNTFYYHNYITNPNIECLHKQYPKCHGTGIKENGEVCLHWIACPCPNCTPRC